MYDVIVEYYIITTCELHVLCIFAATCFARMRSSVFGDRV